MWSCLSVGRKPFVGKDEVFTEEGGELGHQGGHQHLVPEDPDHRDDGVGGPGAHPQHHVGDGHLGDLHLGARLAVLLVALQGVHVHLLRLCLHGALVGNHRFHNLHMENGGA